MKFLLSILVVAMLSITNSITAQNTQTITVTVVNATSDAGKIGYALYTKDNFMGKPIQGKNGKIVNGKSTIVFENVPSGEYAVTCYHDKNNNDKMDFSANRMPLEDYGSSNNVMAFAPPSFENAKFMLKDEDLKLEIKF
ncbi:DUF2141 domain-containing protein [Polaribacter haliotis]|uniref:DUF2141 domain-containing protein n=2 Tax=Polaribacter TaxID=52959 RepID=A0A7L8AGL2_9FLAO|nr:MULTISPECIES: DUF2141 domain-containing protein [Polaribacter]QNM86132.1 DUF2141 domain-containing protein [Polaribacter pectinis]QOD61148.1 DUF2141 domain-containing protein [Polaribacter haliotis]